MRVLVLYAGDLAARSHVAPGGITSCIRSDIGAFPVDWQVEAWGASDRAHPGDHTVPLDGGREVLVRGLVDAGPARERRVPLAPRYCAALAAAALRGQVSRERWDAMLVHRTEYLATLALTARHAELPPAIAFIHGSSAWSVSQMGVLKGLGQRLGERLAIPMAHRVALVSESTLPYYRELYPQWSERFAWLPNGVDVAHFASGDRASWRRAHGFGEDDRVLLFHGRYDAIKGIDRMLAAFALLLEGAKDTERWHLVCVGTGTMRPQIEAAMTTWGRGRLHELGHVGSDQLPSILAGADLTVLFSDVEGLSMGMLESLAAGTPMVATPVGDNRVVLEHVDAALVTDGFEPARLADAVRRAYARLGDLRPRCRPAAERFSREARVRAMSRMVDDAVADTTGSRA